MFIVFEGLDGAGTLQAANLLASHINKTNRKNAVVTSDMNHSSYGSTIKNIMSATTTAEAKYDCVLLARANHVFRALIPAIAQGQTVVCARYLHSTLAYQGGAMGLDRAAIMREHHCKGFPYPDFVFYLDISAATAENKLIERGEFDRYGESSYEFFDRAREIFLEYFEDDAGKNCKTIDAERSVESVNGEILSTFKELYQ